MSAADALQEQFGDLGLTVKLCLGHAQVSFRLQQTTDELSTINLRLRKSEGDYGGLTDQKLRRQTCCKSKPCAQIQT